MSGAKFGDPVTFTHQYLRFVGRQAVWPRGSASRYGRAPHYKAYDGEPHPDSIADQSPPRATGFHDDCRIPVVWKRVPNLEGELTGLFAGNIIRHEGWMSTWRDEYSGHAFREARVVRLAEVLLAPRVTNGPARFAVVHLDDIEASR